MKSGTTKYHTVRSKTMAPITSPGHNDPFSTVSHMVAALVFLWYGFRLFLLSRGSLVRVVSVTVYIFSVIFLLSMSGVYHLLETGGEARAVLQRLDHAGIFVLIAGTFTPIHAILFRGFFRWGFLAIIWTLAITGLVLKTIFFDDLPEWEGLVFYIIGFGWMGAVTGYLSYRLYGRAFILPLLFGALAYTAGALMDFLRWPTLVPGVIGPHELFHIAIIAGIAWHWQFIDSIVKLPPAEKS